jgi:hypothetical protein
MRKAFEPGNTIGKTGGRPKGARNRLARTFLEDCYADWQEHGAAAIKVMRMEDPAGYCKMMASLVPRELELTSTVLTELSDDDLEATIQFLLRQKLESNAHTIDGVAVAAAPSMKLMEPINGQASKTPA